MSFSNYTCDVIDPFTGARLAIFTAQQMAELRFSVKINDIGALTITFERNIEEIWNLFSFPDILIDMYRNEVLECTYLALTRQRGLDDSNKEFVVIGGLSLEHLLTYRRIDPESDSVQPNGGYVTKAGAVDTVLYDLLREQLGDLAPGNRSMPNLTVQTVAGTGPAIGIRERYSVLAEVVLKKLRQTDVDIEFVHPSDNLIDVYLQRRGTDRSYGTNYPSNPYTVFSPLRANLQNLSYMEDNQATRTYVYVAGKGEGANRSILKLSNNLEIVKSPYGRKELYEDSRDSETVGELLTKGQGLLIENLTLTEFEFEIVGERGGSTYRVDWFLGDTVTVAWGDVIQDVRIVGFEISLTALEEKLTITISSQE